MSINNDVFSVMVSSGDQAILAAGQPLSALSVGQIGFFDANTNLSIAGPARDFFIAVGLDAQGGVSGSVLDSIQTSAGQKIQSKNIRDLSFRGHTASQPQIVKVANYKADCDTDYAIRVEIRDQEIYRRQGYNQFTKIVTVRTSCCDVCDICPSGDANEITQLMLNEINVVQAGSAGFTAEPLARQALTIATHGTVANYAAGDVITDADLVAMIAFNATQTDETLKVFSDLQLTSSELQQRNFCNINLLYYHPRQRKLIVSTVEGFDCNGDVTVEQEYVAEEGNGYDIQQKEYHSGAWDGNPGPYVLSTATGTAKDRIFRATTTETYDQFVLTYDLESVGGWLEYKNNLATIVAIPEEDTTTRDGFATALDAITAGLGFDPLADDAAAVSSTPTDVETTSGLDDVNLDGDA